MRRNAVVGLLLLAALTATVLTRTTSDHETAGHGQAAGNPPKAGARPVPGRRAPAVAAKPGSSTAGTTPAAPAGGVDADKFFTPHRLAPGQKPPQFVVVSFDGVGSHEKWEFWRGVADTSGGRFTGFLSGVYLLDGAHRTAYTAPGHKPGTNSLGYWYDAAQVRTLVGDLNGAWAHGFELGTHYNGHFCAGDPPGGGAWSTTAWNSELDQFMRFWTDFRTIDQLAGVPPLAAPASSIQGGRTPCLEDKPAALMPALAAHHFSYDTSGTSNGIAWPERNQWGIWEFPLAYVPMAGTHRGVVSMDYNFWVSQTGNPPSTKDPAANSDQVLRTYRQMYQDTYDGNRAPLVLGNHFNSWNGNAYSDALAAFVKETCKKPDTICVPYRDVIRWMGVQDPAVLSRLQAQPAVDTVG
jgi:hypothetical protein